MSTPQANRIDPNEIDSRLQTVTEFVIDHQMRNGAWPLDVDDDQPNIEATGLGLLWLVRYVQYKSRNAPGEPLLERAKESILKGLKYLRDHQQPDNQQTEMAGWGDHPGGHTRVLPTGMAVFALARYLSWQKKQGKNPEQAYIDAVTKGLNWLKEDIHKHWNHRSEQRDLAAKHVYWTCTALKEANLVIRDSEIESTLDHAFAVVRKESKHKGGGWGAIFSDAPELAPTAYLTYLLRRYSKDPGEDAAKQSFEYVRQGYDGLNFKDHPPVEEIARSIITLLESDKDCQSDKIREGIKYLLSSSYVKDTYGWRSYPLDPPDLIATHSACRALLEYLEKCAVQSGGGGSRGSTASVPAGSVAGSGSAQSGSNGSQNPGNQADNERKGRQAVNNPGVGPIPPEFEPPPREGNPIRH